MWVVGSEIAPSPTLKLYLSHGWPNCAVCSKNEKHGFRYGGNPILARSA